MWGCGCEWGFNFQNFSSLYSRLTFLKLHKVLDIQYKNKIKSHQQLYRDFFWHSIHIHKYMFECPRVISRVSLCLLIRKKRKENNIRSTIVTLKFVPGSGLIHSSKLDPGLQTPPISFSEEDFRWCVMAVAWWILQKGKNTRPFRPFPSIQDRFPCTNKPVSSGHIPWIYQHSVAVSLRPAMAAHKPVEWVQAVITRFDEQVRWVDSVNGCSKLLQSWGPNTVNNAVTWMWSMKKKRKKEFRLRSVLPSGAISRQTCVLYCLSRLLNTEEEVF